MPQGGLGRVPYFGAVQVMAKANKAHVAVVRRLNERYGNGADNSNGFDVHIGDLVIEVETSATLHDGFQKLQGSAGRRYIAVTNQEAIDDAMALTKESPIGVMNPWGDILRDAVPPEVSPAKSA